jgi:hypothetical protein
MVTKQWLITIRQLTPLMLWSSRVLRLVVGLLLLVLFMGVATLVFLRWHNGARQLAPFRLPYVQNFKDVHLTGWLAQSGNWSIRNETLVQVANPDKPALIFVPLKLSDEQLYHLSVHITLAATAKAAGINFNAQYPKLTEQTQQVYIARKPASGKPGKAKADGMELVAGYTDGTGKFIRQVSVPFAVDTHNYWLDLYVVDNTYTVQLNGQPLIEGRPFFYRSGAIGFYSLGRATFDTLTVVPVCPGRKPSIATEIPGCPKTGQ